MIPTIGHLRLNTNRRWEIDASDDNNSIELSCGSVIEVWIAGVWIKTAIEHDGRVYYATQPGVRLSEGLRARVGFK